jgi:ribosomal protein S18 acetylase RimI-like enzyme
MNIPPNNPVWQALSSLQHHFNEGSNNVKYFPRDVSPFVGMEHWHAEAIAALEAQVPADRSFSFMLDQNVQLPPTFEIIFACTLYQMHCLSPMGLLTEKKPISILGAADISQMLSLTGNTKPGPFYEKTYTMGRYYGIFQNEKLVSMAGERLALPGFTEMSAICTHPDYLGNGYALLLTNYVAEKILHAGDIPFLHVKTDNKRAIEVYQRAGFDIKKEIYFAVFKKL